MGNYTIFLKFENLRRGRQARNFSENDPKILDLKSSSEQIIFRKLSLGAPENLKIYENNILEGWEYEPKNKWFTSGKVKVVLTFWALNIFTAGDLNQIFTKVNIFRA